jgi:tartrate dehydrogenase/decarboxylase/D-malate dehydrogenase
MMLEHLGHPLASKAIIDAFEKILAAGPLHAPFTPDMGGTGNTSDFGKAIAQAI